MRERTSLAITVKAPGACDAEELKAFERFVRKGGEVQSHGLATLVRQANALAFVHSSRQVVGVGALKQPLAGYRKSVFEKSAAVRAAAEFPVELGWIYVAPAERGKGHSGRLVEALLKRAPDAGIFATSRTDNTPMHRSLERFGFVRAGKPYTSTRGRYKLQLFVRSAAQARAGGAAPRTARPSA